MMKRFFGILSIMALMTTIHSQITAQLPYNGGNIFQFGYNNPAHMNQLMNGVTATPQECKEIPGVGLPVLSLKKFLIAVDQHLENTNQNSFVKIIYLKETRTQNGINTKLVVAIKTFNDLNFIGVSGELRLKGTQKFRLNSYHYDTDIKNIREILQEPSIDPNNFIGCGNLKDIYTNYIRRHMKPEFLQFNQPYGQTQMPFHPNHHHSHHMGGPMGNPMMSNVGSPMMRP